LAVPISATICCCLTLLTTQHTGTFCGGGAFGVGGRTALGFLPIFRRCCGSVSYIASGAWRTGAVNEDLVAGAFTPYTIFRDGAAVMAANCRAKAQRRRDVRRCNDFSRQVSPSRSRCCVSPPLLRFRRRQAWCLGELFYILQTSLLHISGGFMARRADRSSSALRVHCLCETGTHGAAGAACRLPRIAARRLHLPLCYTLKPQAAPSPGICACALTYLYASRTAYFRRGGPCL